MKESCFKLKASYCQNVHNQQRLFVLQTCLSNQVLHYSRRTGEIFYTFYRIHGFLADCFHISFSISTRCSFTIRTYIITLSMDLPSERPSFNIGLQKIFLNRSGTKEERTINTILKPEQNILTQDWLNTKCLKNSISSIISEGNLPTIPVYNTIHCWLNEYMNPAIDEIIKEQRSLSIGN